MTREANYFQKDPPGAWVTEAACRGSQGTHFPDAPVNTPERIRQVEYAQMVCGPCPVKRECHELATKNREREGVWGGEDFDPYVRRARRRRELRVGTFKT